MKEVFRYRRRALSRKDVAGLRRLIAQHPQAVAERLERRRLEPGDYALLKVVIDTVCFLSRQVRQKATSIQRLLQMIFGARTEKTRAVLNRGVTAEPATETPGEKPPRKGHGRRAANAYWGARKVQVSHSQFKVGQKCPACDQGQLYDTGRPLVLLYLRIFFSLLYATYSLAISCIVFVFHM